MEAVRSRIRELVGYRSWPYVAAAKFINFCYALGRGGLAGVMLLGMRRGSGAGRWMKFPSLLFPVFVRPGTDDVDAIINNVLREEYGQFRRGFEPAIIVDAGAYIGDTSAYFLSRFGAARVIALEPSRESHAIAERNLQKYGERVTLLPLALWSEDGTVRFSGEQTGFALSDAGVESQAIAMPTLMRKVGMSHIDLLKMDIEGAESAVLGSGAGGWLRDVSVLLLETHGRDIEAATLPLLKKEGFTIRRHRNVWYCERR